MGSIVGNLYTVARTSGMTGGGRRIIVGVVLCVRRSKGGHSASVAIERVRRGLRHCWLIVFFDKLQILDPGSCKYHTMSESLAIFTFPKFRDEHLKQSGSAILSSTSLFPRRILNQRKCSGDNSSGLLSTPQSN